MPLDRTTLKRRSPVILATALVVAYCAFLVPLRGSLGPVLALPSDDAFYYFQIARNIVAGEGCTFDRIAPTNGFHPLWMLCVLAVFSLADGDAATPVQTILAGSVVLSLVTLVLLHRLVEKYIAPGCGLVAVAACLLPNVLSAMLNGMETGLVTFSLVVLLWLCYQRRLLDPAARPRRAFALGVLLGVVTLCRLDTVFFFISVVCLSIASSFLARLSIRQCLLRVVALSAGFAATTSAYILWNLTAFGHIMPVSGAVKSSFPLPRESLTLKGDMRYGALLLGALLILAALIALADRGRGGVRAAVRSPLSILVLGCALHFMYAFLFLTWGVYWWHFVPYGVGIAILSARLVAGLAASSARWRSISVAVLATGLFLVAVVMKPREIEIKYERHLAWFRGAEWAREHTPPNAVFAMKDAGLFGYFSDRRVINLDGKANGYEYQGYLNANDVKGYLKRWRVTFIADIRAKYNAGECRIVIPRVNEPYPVLALSRAAEVYQSEPIPAYAARFGEAPEAHFAIWRSSELLAPGGR